MIQIGVTVRKIIENAVDGVSAVDSAENTTPMDDRITTDTVENAVGEIPLESLDIPQHDSIDSIFNEESSEMKDNDIISEEIDF